MTRHEAAAIIIDSSSFADGLEDHTGIRQDGIKLSKEEWKKSKRYINKIYKTAEEKAVSTGIEVINELIRRGKNPTPGIENKLRELVFQPIFESAKAKADAGCRIRSHADGICGICYKGFKGGGLNGHET